MSIPVRDLGRTWHRSRSIHHSVEFERCPTSSAVHHLSAGVVEMLRARRHAQVSEQLACRQPWTVHRYEGRCVSLVFTKEDGGLVNRQKVAKAVTRAAEKVDIDPARIATDTGRRTAVTVLDAEAGRDLSDIAALWVTPLRPRTATFALGERPKATAATAAAMLDPTSADRHERPPA